MHILIVDDGEEARILYEFAFGLEGHTAQCAITGVEALSLIEQGFSYDAIVMDLHMPEMDGIQAVRRLRGLPQGEQVPVIMLTGDRNHQHRDKALEAGANLVLFKPCLPHTVLEHIKACDQAIGQSDNLSLR